MASRVPGRVRRPSASHRVRRVGAVLLPGALAGGALLAVAPPVSASCALSENRQVVAESQVAFVGTAIAREGDRYTFAVERALRGPVGATIEVLDPFGAASESLNPRIGERLGLVARRDASGALVATGCDTFAPDVLVAAAASAAAGRTTCALPQTLPLTVRRRRDGRTVHLSARVSGGEPGGRAVVTWGDGRTTTVPLDPSDRSRTTVRATHRYRRAGTRRIELVVVTPRPADCGSRYTTTGPADPRSAVVTTTVRLRTR